MNPIEIILICIGGLGVLMLAFSPFILSRRMSKSERKFHKAMIKTKRINRILDKRDPW